MKKTIKGSIITFVISMYCLFNAAIMYVLPNTFFKLITWIGSEEII